MRERIPWISLTLALPALALALTGCGGEVDVRPDDTPPQSTLTATPSCGAVPLEVAFDASASFDDDTAIVGYAWDFDGDGLDDSLTLEPRATHTYAETGTLYAQVRVTNRDSLSSAAAVEIWALPVDAEPSLCLYRNRNLLRVRDIEYTLGLSRYTYARGDTLRFFYQIRNGRPRTVEFTLHWTCAADFFVFAGSCTTMTAEECLKKWRLTDNETCTARLTRITIPPLEAEWMTATWFPRFPLSAGCYTAFGMVYSGPPSPSDSTLVWLPFEVQ